MTDRAVPLSVFPVGHNEPIGRPPGMLQHRRNLAATTGLPGSPHQSRQHGRGPRVPSGDCVSIPDPDIGEDFFEQREGFWERLVLSEHHCLPCNHHLDNIGPIEAIETVHSEDPGLASCRVSRVKMTEPVDGRPQSIHQRHQTLFQRPC